jgi:hypothetical protein
VKVGRFIDIFIETCTNLGIDIEILGYLLDENFKINNVHILFQFIFSHTSIKFSQHTLSHNQNIKKNIKNGSTFIITTSVRRKDKTFIVDLL